MENGTSQEVPKNEVTEQEPIDEITEQNDIPMDEVEEAMAQPEILSKLAAIEDIVSITSGAGIAVLLYAIKYLEKSGQPPMETYADHIELDTRFADTIIAAVKDKYGNVVHVEPLPMLHNAVVVREVDSEKENGIKSLSVFYSEPSGAYVSLPIEGTMEQDMAIEIGEIFVEYITLYNKEVLEMHSAKDEDDDLIPVEENSDEEVETEEQGESDASVE